MKIILRQVQISVLVPSNLQIDRNKKNMIMVGTQCTHSGEICSDQSMEVYRLIVQGGGVPFIASIMIPYFYNMAFYASNIPYLT